MAGPLFADLCPIDYKLQDESDERQENEAGKDTGFSYKHFLYGAVTFASLLAALFKVGVFGDSVSPPMAFVFAIFYLAFMAWAIGQLYKIHTAKEQPAAPFSADVSMAGEEMPGEETLLAAETYVGMGEDLDTVCLFVNPKYRDWDASRKLAYKQGLRTLLNERRERLPGA
ncbi:MAG TPA: hypothetical protein VL285_11795 [Bryobacteraceae bacterium]|jgi:hypothetical protein|nr:hypothetical protein [Bryobacteraceae bacterium]